MSPLSPLIFIFIFSSVISAMEKKEIIHPLETPDIIKLTAYALVDVCKDTPGIVLPSLINLSSVNKLLRKTVLPLLNERDKTTGELSEASAQFNNYAISTLENHFHRLGKNSPKCLATAYLGTPFCFPIIKKEYETSSPSDFSEKLDGFSWTEEKSKRFALMHGIRFVTKWEPLDQTLKKFPPSTQKFCNKLIEEKQKEKTADE